MCGHISISAVLLKYKDNKVGIYRCCYCEYYKYIIAVENIPKFVKILQKLKLPMVQIEPAAVQK